MIALVDFGCGGGIDVILAAHKVGEKDRVVGLDFAPHMIERAKQALLKFRSWRVTPSPLMNSRQWLVVQAKNLRHRLTKKTSFLWKEKWLVLSLRP